MLAIKDMKMPSCCGLCERYLRTCEYHFENAQTKRHPNCPLVEIEERKVGEWVDIHDREEWYGDQYKCSLCGAITIDNGLYCPNCGSKMTGSEQE